MEQENREYGNYSTLINGRCIMRDVSYLRVYVGWIHINRVLIYGLKYSDNRQPLSDTSIIYLFCHLNAHIEEAIHWSILCNPISSTIVSPQSRFILTIRDSRNSAIINRMDPGDKAPGSRRLLSSQCRTLASTFQLFKVLSRVAYVD